MMATLVLVIPVSDAAILKCGAHHQAHGMTTSEMLRAVDGWRDRQLSRATCHKIRLRSLPTQCGWRRSRGGKVTVDLVVSLKVRFPPDNGRIVNILPGPTCATRRHGVTYSIT
jgi:hypothetical protein